MSTTTYSEVELDNFAAIMVGGSTIIHAHGSHAASWWLAAGQGLCFGLYLAGCFWFWRIVRRALERCQDKRRDAQFPAAERFRATKAANRDKLKPSSASVRGALREGER